MPETALKPRFAANLLLAKKVLCNYIKDVSLRIIKFLVKGVLLINVLSCSQTSKLPF